MKELLFHSLEQAGVSAYGVERIRIAAAQMVEDNITPAQVIVAARKGTLLVHQANGKFGPELGAAELTVDAIYPLCSITKLFTATAIMMLMEQGKIGLNRPVSDYIPEFTGEGKTKVCVHHLLTHTSGLEGEVIWQNGQLKKEQGEYPPHEPNQDPDQHKYLYGGYDAPLSNEPGTVMSYCGYGYELLGEIIRRVSGQAYDVFVKETIFQPLGMENTYYRVPMDVRDKVVRRAPEAACAEWVDSEYNLNSVSAGAALTPRLWIWLSLARCFLTAGYITEYDSLVR